MTDFENSLVTLSMEELIQIEILIEEHEEWWEKQIIFEIGIGELLKDVEDIR